MRGALVYIHQKHFFKQCVPNHIKHIMAETLKKQRSRLFSVTFQIEFDFTFLCINFAWSTRHLTLLIRLRDYIPTHKYHLLNLPYPLKVQTHIFSQNHNHWVLRGTSYNKVPWSKAQHTGPHGVQTHELEISSLASPTESGGAKWKNLPDFSSFSWFFHLFPDFPLFFLDFSLFFVWFLANFSLYSLYTTPPPPPPPPPLCHCLKSWVQSSMVELRKYACLNELCINGITPGQWSTCHLTSLIRLRDYIPTHKYHLLNPPYPHSPDTHF